MFDTKIVAVHGRKCRKIKETRQKTQGLSLFDSLSSLNDSIGWDHIQARLTKRKLLVPVSSAVVARIRKRHRRCPTFFCPFLSLSATTWLAVTVVGFTMSRRRRWDAYAAVRWPEKKVGDGGRGEERDAMLLGFSQNYSDKYKTHRL